MNFPPTLMHVKVKNERTNFGLWLPLFLLFPLALAVLIVFSPLIVIGLIITWPTGWAQYSLKVSWQAVVAFWSMRGLKVDVQANNQVVYISMV